MGAGNLIAGFVKGASDYGADQIKQRQEADRELQKTKLLEQLRLDTEKEMAVFRDNLDNKKVSKELSSPDYTRGKLVFRNAKGDVTSERDLTPDELQAHSMDTQKDQLGLDNVRSEIGARASSAANDSARVGLDRQRLGLESQRVGIESQRLSLDKKNSGSTTDSGKPILIAEYNNAKDELTKAGANPSILANFETQWYEGVNQKGWSKPQQRTFLLEMRRKFTDHTVHRDGTKGKPLLDSFNAANSLLDSKLPDSPG
jgi:hypothetical protein